MSRVAVIGGGISGLSAAHTLFRSGTDVTLLEAGFRVGGVIRSERADGFLVEHGPNSIQTRTPELLTLLADLGLEDSMVEASDAAKVRYVVRNGRPTAVPTSPPGLLSTKLFSWRARLRLLREPFVPASDASVAESVADFVRRRVGAEILDYGVNPFVAGVYAGDPEQLSVRHAFPQLFDLEQTFGSIIRGQIRQRKASAERVSSRMFSFENGLETLPRTIADELEHRVCTGSRLTSMTRKGGGWMVRYSGGSGHFDAVIYCGPMHTLGDIDLPEHLAFERLRTTQYPPLSVVAMGYDRSAVGHPLDGFGLLVPEKERDFRILGTLFTSSIFPDRAPEGHVLLTSFVGGMRSPLLAQKSANDLFALVHADLRRLLGISAEPTFHRHVFRQHSIPQYHLGYGDTIRSIERLEEAMPGWFMAGNYRRGVAVGDAAASGVNAARRCIEYIT